MALRSPIARCALGAVVALTVSGCGVSLHAGEHAHTSTLAADSSVSAVSHLSPRPRGEVDIDGSTQGSLTPAAAGAYEGLGARIVVSDHGEAQAFARFCRGQTDIVDSSAPISPTQLSVCQAEGVQPVQLQVAGAGLVLAAGAEVDVGADCLTLAQVKQSFQAGSQVTNWSQLGYYNIPLRVAGPGEGGALFDLFGEVALGKPSATLADLRGDYGALGSEAAVRNAVTNGTGATSAQLHSSALASLGALRGAISQAHGFVGAASFQVSKGIHDKRSARAKARDRANLAHAEANLATLRGDLPAAERYVHQTAVASARFRSELGTLGYFSFAYYEAHQEELRPFEIDNGSLGSQPNCIFPSAQTIGDGAYPLSRRLLLTVSLQDMRRAEVGDFLRFYLTHAPGLAAAAELVPLSASTLSSEISWLDGKSQPPVLSYTPVAGAAGGAQSTTASQAAIGQGVLVPAGGAGDEVSPADVPTHGASGPQSSSGEVPSSGESTLPQVAGSQSSQPLIGGQ